MDPPSFSSLPVHTTFVRITHHMPDACFFLRKAISLFLFSTPVRLQVQSKYCMCTVCTSLCLGLIVYFHLLFAKMNENEG